MRAVLVPLLALAAATEGGEDISTVAAAQEFVCATYDFLLAAAALSGVLPNDGLISRRKGRLPTPESLEAAPLVQCVCSLPPGTLRDLAPPLYDWLSDQASSSSRPGLLRERMRARSESGSSGGVDSSHTYTPGGGEPSGAGTGFRQLRSSASDTIELPVSEELGASLVAMVPALLNVSAAICTPTCQQAAGLLLYSSFSKALANAAAAQGNAQVADAMLALDADLHAVTHEVPACLCGDDASSRQGAASLLSALAPFVDGTSPLDSARAVVAALETVLMRAGAAASELLCGRCAGAVHKLVAFILNLAISQIRVPAFAAEVVAEVAPGLSPNAMTAAVTNALECGCRKNGSLAVLDGALSVAGPLLSSAVEDGQTPDARRTPAEVYGKVCNPVYHLTLSLGAFLGAAYQTSCG